MSIARHHAEWLSLVPVSGPFLSLPVLMEACNTGLEPHYPDLFRLLRQENGNWLDSFEKSKADPAPHQRWIRFVLNKTLELDDKVLLEGQAIPQTLQTEVPEHHSLLRPNMAVIDPATKKPCLLIQTYPRAQDLNNYVPNSRWKASPDTRMTILLRATGISLGLVTNGEHWMLVNALKDEMSGYASWYASLWLEEQITLRAFRTFLSASRFFGEPEKTLESLLLQSASNQQEVTDQLGYQVRRAVEVLIYSLDRADQDFGRELLSGITEEALYESALTVMMRLVFLFCAEERELIPSKPFPVYDQNYSVSTISKQLRELADQQGEELLERRYDAWPRLLAAFRAVYGGLRHDDVHIPVYGGSLFNPDRFPFLEGRKNGTSWRDTEASPLPINNRTVLHLLEALQLLQIKMPGGGKAEARRLSFRALDIEQIGHVYEGLLDHTAKRSNEPFLGLAGTRNNEPEIPLAELEKHLAKGEAELIKYLKETTGKQEKALTKLLKAELDTQDVARFRTACQGDNALWKRVQPFAGFVRIDNFGYPVIILTGNVFVTAGTDRRSTGTHYTPRSLTEPIVQYTLEPLVYVGPAEGIPKSEWKLKSARELLDLKICDMACGSGAFLVQAARYMSERLLEAWEAGTDVRGPWSGDREAGTDVREPWSGDREAGSVDREAGTVDRGTAGGNDGSTVFSGSGSVEGGDGTGSGMLSADKELSQGRTFWNDEPDSASSSVDSGEHCGRSGAEPHKGVPELPEHRQGITDGGAIPSVSRSTSGSPERTGFGAPADSLRTNKPNDIPTPASPGEKGEPGTVNREAGTEGREPWTVNRGAGTEGREPLQTGSSRSTPHGSRLTVHASRLTPHGPRITPHGSLSTGSPDEMLIPEDAAERKTYAMRLIAQRCLYGVDKNPLAVEMAKLSLWLLTVAKDKPFEFLDHSLRCGDSLVGLHSIDQLRHYSLKPEAEDAVLFKGPLDGAVDEAINLRLKLEDLPANSVEDVERQEKLLQEASEKIARLRCAADLLVAAEFWGGNAKDKLARVQHAAIKSGYYVEKGPTDEFERVAREAWSADREDRGPLSVNRGSRDSLSVDRDPSSRSTDPGPRTTLSGSRSTVSSDPGPRTTLSGSRSTPDSSRTTPDSSRSTLSPFHWCLEFPEVIVKRGGFDAFVGNPPFLGGRLISGNFGVGFLKYLHQSVGVSVGQTDLCAYFFRRAAKLLRKEGAFGLLATKTISEGDTATTGLAYITAHLCVHIYSVRQSVPWPGVAAVRVTWVHGYRGEWSGEKRLDGFVVAYINAELKAGVILEEPYQLSNNDEKCFKGFDLGGTGFALTLEEGKAFRVSYPAEAALVKPYIIGRELYTSPLLAFGRMAIDFCDMTLEEAERFPNALRLVRERVKPYREGVRRIATQRYWWIYNEHRPGLRRAITDLKRVLVKTHTSNTWAFAFLPTSYLFDQSLIVIPSDNHCLFALLQSEIHFAWATRNPSTMKGDLRYTTGHCLASFPFLEKMKSLSDCGVRLYDSRSNWLFANENGLTVFYQRFHDPEETSADIQKLRELHIEMDKAVAAAYGWSDLKLDHGFHETKQGIRFTISDAARREVLQRLLKLNHERYAEEVKQGLHEKKGGAGRVKDGGKKKGKTNTQAGPSLFPEEEDA